MFQVFIIARGLAIEDREMVMMMNVVDANDDCELTHSSFSL